MNLLAPNDFYRPPKVYHKKFDKNQMPVGLLDYQFSLARPQIHWPWSLDQWVFMMTDLMKLTYANYLRDEVHKLCCRIARNITCHFPVLVQMYMLLNCS
jgi:hypothetical protein